MRTLGLYAFAAALIWGGLAPIPVVAQEAANAGPRISGLMFGDYYWVASSHQSELVGRSGWWFRRVYLTLDQDISETWTTRTRLEFSQPGDFQGNVRMEPFLKDMYVQGTSGLHSIQLGLVSTPAFESYEKAWGYRAVEKAPLDLYGFAPSRDVGFAAKGAFGHDQKLRYHLLVGNGSGTGTEVDKGKNVALALAYSPMKSLTVEVYGDIDGLTDHVNRNTLQGSLYFVRGRVRSGAQYAHQVQSRDDVEDTSFDIASVFGSVSVHPHVSGFARMDRQFQANPSAHRIAYFPFAEDTETTLFIAGLDVALHDAVRLLPNVEIARFDNPATGERTAVMPRLTLFYQF